ncbi:Mitochondrial adenine nucleotide transporter ADNT1-like protein [Drosera capensis]
MASEDVNTTTSEAAVSRIVNLAEEAKLAREGVKAPGYAVFERFTEKWRNFATLRRLDSIFVCIVCYTVDDENSFGVSRHVRLRIGEKSGSQTAVAPLERMKILLQETSIFSSFPLWVEEGEDVELTPLLCLGAGACAGIIAMSVTYPMDMVQGRFTVQIPLGHCFPLLHNGFSLPVQGNFSCHVHYTSARRPESVVQRLGPLCHRC